MEETHKLITAEFPYFSAPVIYLASCSCGKYTSGKRVTKLDAEKSWLQHMIAKTQNEPDRKGV